MKNNDVLAYDCDGVALYEFDIVRTLWYADMDFEVDTEIDPRQYCVIKSEKSEPCLVSVYDNWNKKAINKFEGREENAEVPRKILPITESVNYEKAYDSMGNDFVYSDSKSQLTLTLNKKELD